MKVAKKINQKYTVLAGVLSDHEEIDVMKAIFKLGGSGVFDKDLAKEHIPQKIVDELTRRGLLNRKETPGTKFGDANWSITKDGLSAMKQAKISTES